MFDSVMQAILCLAVLVFVLDMAIGFAQGRGFFRKRWGGCQANPAVDAATDPWKHLEGADVEYVRVYGDSTHFTRGRCVSVSPTHIVMQVQSTEKDAEQGVTTYYYPRDVIRRISVFTPDETIEKPPKRQWEVNGVIELPLIWVKDRSTGEDGYILDYTSDEAALAAGTQNSYPWKDTERIVVVS